MALVDTLDGILMLWAYGWAFVDPASKLGYNIFVTLTSAVIALVIAGVETLSVLAVSMHWKGPFWSMMVNAPFEVLGWLIIGLFLTSLTVSLLMYRCSKGGSKVEHVQRRQSAPPRVDPPRDSFSSLPGSPRDAAALSPTRTAILGE
jgi:hypothetical protein